MMIRALLTHLILFITKLITKTCRYEIIGLEKYVEYVSSNKCILALWHNRILLAPQFLSSYTPQYTYSAFISNSRDGQLIATATEAFPNGETIRVPHNSKHTALKKTIKVLNQGKILIFTPDGPRGPKYSIKPGIIFAAKAAKANIIPFSWKASRYWKLPTWDKMMIPKPFSKITFTFNEAIPYQNDDETIRKAIKKFC